ncbi:RNA polymerase sigma factor [Streptomyces sp. NPDC086033]|uniref:RNA polymerase sigma factor n=1 Tax=Streptomyces sp. NPDC086033 TaxID=3365747 RepID=UPI0037CEC10B
MAESEPADRVGWQEALAELYEAHHPLLLRIVRRRTAAGEDSDDIAHNIWLEFGSYLRKHDPQNPAALLFKLAGWRIIDELGTRRARAMDKDAVQRLAETAVPHTESQSDLQADLAEALGSLDLRAQYALELHYVCGLTVAQCASELNTGVDNTKKILKLALARLRAHDALRRYATVTSSKEEGK